jgi:NTP pyrophosphatase (non-canonical NTP hydrolase)
MTFDNLRAMNRARCEAPEGFNHAIDIWRPSQWTNAAAGEMGETCNIAKKMDRIYDGARGNRKAEDATLDSLTLQAADEIADVVIYMDLLCQRLGLRLETVIRDKWNKTSAEIGYPARI